MMKRETGEKFLGAGILFLLFLLFTVLVKYVDVRIWETGTPIGFSTINIGIFKLFGGYHELLFLITDLCALPALGLAAAFGFFGLWQWIRRKDLRKVDPDLFVLGGFYIAVMAAYFSFEIFVVDCRPVLMDGVAEASYPSSHTMVAVAVFATAVMQMKERLKNKRLCLWLRLGMDVFTAFTVVGRLLCGAHWFTDIVGGLIMSAALVEGYRAFISLIREEKR